MFVLEGRGDRRNDHGVGLSINPQQNQISGVRTQD